MPVVRSRVRIELSDQARVVATRKGQELTPATQVIRY